MPQRIVAEQRIHEYTQSIHAPPGAVFPLLCPEREKEWIPGWTARMIHSLSGLAEAGAIFATPSGDGETLWYIAMHEPPRCVRFVRWQPDGVFADIEIGVEAAGRGSRVRVRYVFTALEPRGTVALQQLTDAFWQEMMRTWESRMNAFLASR